MQKIRKVIIPVAGFGTRFLPATKSQPKEMLPVADKPVIQYLVEEVVASGVEEIIFVTGRGKRSIEDHFDTSYELEQNLVERGKEDLLVKIRQISTVAKISYVRQALPLGDGHAILQAAHLVHGEPVLVLFGDCIYDSATPASLQLIDEFLKQRCSIIGTAKVAKSEISNFGVIERGTDGLVEHILEKPQPSQTSSSEVAVGKYIITPEIIEILATMQSGKSGEIRLADAFDIALSAKKIKSSKPNIAALELDGLWLDTGTPANLLKANIHFSLKDPSISPEIIKYIASIK